MAETGHQEPGIESPNADDQEWFHSHRSVDPLISSEPIPQGRRKKQSGLPVVLAGLALLMVAAAVIITKYPPHFSLSSSSSTNGDLQQGISNSTGLRGHLVTRLENGKTTRYMLKIEPIDPREDAAFAYVMDNQPQPMAIDVRVLDSTGFSLCGKQIVIPYNPTRLLPGVTPRAKSAEAAKLLAARQAALVNLSAQEQAREKGNDVFKLITGEDGKVQALWSEGTLPCSPDQFQRFDYWNFDTNFPTVVAQQQMMGHDKLVAKKAEEDARAAKHPVYKKGPPEFYIEGDDRARNFDTATGVLSGGAGHSFTIPKKTDQTTIAQWVSDDSLIHYTCDQHAVCVLRHAGSPAVIIARMNE